MKYNIFWMFLAVLTLFGTACTDDFENINTDPNKVTDMEEGYLLTRIWMRYNGSPHEEHRGALILAGPLSGLFQCGYRTGQAFSGTADGYNEAKMVEMYADAIKHGVHLRELLSDDATGENEAKLAIANIALQFSFQRVTDLYGDVPFNEAGIGYHNKVFYPAYDSQEDIYKQGVEVLKDARNTLMSTSTKPFRVSNDIIYGGIADDTERKEAWAKLANSLILRMGLRGVNGDEAWAKSTVEEAANHAAGYITSNETTDAALIPTGDIGGDWGMIVNGAASLISGSGGYVFVGEEWLRQAQQNRDPRIFYVASQAVHQGSSFGAWTGQEDFDAFEEAARPGEPFKPVTFNPLRGGGTESFSVRGLMVKKNEAGEEERVFGNWFINEEESVKYNQFHTMTIVNPETLGKRTAPLFLYSGDESYYILAEAAMRGWNVPSTVNANLEKAIELSLEKYPTYFDAPSVGEYIAKQSVTEGEKISYDDLSADYINTILSGTIDYQTIWRERWKSCMTAQGGYEAFAIWNRTNVELQPGYASTGRSYPGTEKMEMPVYNAADVEIENMVLGQVIPTADFSEQPFHNGGDTEGWRPRRINYPERERSNNTEHVESAIQNQIKEHGQVGNGVHFVTTYQWYSKKVN
ncbi:SusD/RagB family nutrient-binding outer membrane lipoprotein [Carboxylicivirga sp. A043]|uniref:SusD/RagB family nutrient-binding outer membrane lipoprotein n=1 Tax=Carboxylicivirga litoralis TaxID=2816963 RepID=UPI0021CB6A8C|nr:SusD/RagB family nutrient-binding outer membrane lipoprotein [Carboxylicivirga sp. A043]MCU4156365.1 SusD/RagB family nutrient-binding outer membrane lipoprotein [Carboxylicivirga sp. A043]